MKGKSYQTNLPQAQKHKVCEFNELISCHLCNGYLINPTTVDYCYHTFCRSCIVKYLQTNSVCPQCKSIGGKRIDVNNLKIDDILRKFIFKLVPGLYHDERERLAHMNESRNTEALMEVEENIFSLTEPISLSLEYHPDLLANCSEDQIPPIRYLQCPAGVKIQHLKHLICSKYEIDPENKNVQVEIIYEDEVLQSDFSLMDVGYCYNWNRAAPMRFRYRILIYAQEHKLKVKETEINKQLKLKKVKKDYEDEEEESLVIAENNVQQTCVTVVEKEKILSGNTKSVTFATEKTYIDAPTDEINDKNQHINNNNNNNSSNNNNHQHYNHNDHNIEYKLKSSLKVRKSKYKIDDYDEASGLPPPAVKMVIARKPALLVEPQRKTSLKRTQNEISTNNNNNNNNNNNSNNNNTVNYSKNSTIVTNDFKCLRSNDMRYSDYAVTSSTTTNHHNNNNNKLPKNDKIQLTTTSTTTNVSTPPTVVVSIPRFPLSSIDKDELFENVTLAQLKTASSKKATTDTTTKVENHLPKLKISLQKSDNFEQNYEDIELGLKTHKVRKRDVEATTTSGEQVDLETYVKNIGLKPINTPNASPQSSHSSNSSTTTSSTSLMDVDYPASTHKKRKKKHHSKEGNGGSKKRKLHAEISSQNADESLKMKVKITPAHHSHRGHHKLATITEEKLIETATSTAVTEPAVVKPAATNGEIEKKQEETEETIIIPASPPLPPSLFKPVPPPPPPLALSSVTTPEPKTKSPSPKPTSPKLLVTPCNTPAKTFAVPSTMRKFNAIMPAKQQQQQMPKLQKKCLKQLEMKTAIDSFTHNFKLPKLPIMKQSSSNFVPTFDNRPLYTPMASAALNDFTKRLGANTVTITSRPKVSNSNNKSAYQMCDLSVLQKQQQTNQIKTSLDFMRAANAGKAAALSFSAAARKAEVTRTTLMGPPLSTILKSPKKVTNSKLPTHNLSALSYNMSPHVPLSIASLAAVAAAAGNINAGTSTTTTLPHGVRSPPLPLTTALAAAKNKSPYRQTPPALINLSSPVNMLFPPFKFPHNKSSALDLSGNSAKNTPSNCNTLEAALNKMKQNIMSCTVTTAERELMGSTTTTTTTSPTDNLRNMPNLSKEREKLKSPAAMVRPQNASVRNIPNPSALAFRNQPTAIKSPPPPSTPTPTPPPPPLLPTTTTSTVSATTTVSVNNKNVANNSIQSPPLRATKKPTTIDQVAANLNMRAAAAALSASVKSEEEPDKLNKFPNSTTTTTTNNSIVKATSNGETTTNKSIGSKEEKQETSKSTTTPPPTTTTTATTITMPKPASNFKSISENSCTSPGPTNVTSIKLEKIAVE